MYKVAKFLLVFIMVCKNCRGESDIRTGKLYVRFFYTMTDCIEPLICLSDEGVVFHGFFRGNQHSTKQSQESKSNQNKPILEKSFSLADLAEDVKKRKEDQMEVMMQRVPLLYRGYQVSCDVKSKTFAVIQNDPKIG